jgi:2-oxoglutarate dehydrogenase E2 component (dihydrolipoamide succinyltransferase)
MPEEHNALRVPELPESVSDATVVALHGKPGDSVLRDELLVELETDKVVLEVPAPFDGVIAEFTVEEGAVVEAGAVLGYLTAASAAKAGDEAVDEIPPRPPGPDRTEARAKPSAPEPATEPRPPPSPAVRRLLGEHGLQAEDIEGTGQDGRLIKQDVERFLAARKSGEPAAESAPTARAPAPIEHAAESPGPRTEERVPMSRLRARIAERLLEAKQTTAMLTTFNEVDLSQVTALRARHKDAFEKRHGVRLGFMSFFVAACAQALRRFPVVNAALDGHEIVYHHYSDIGIAVSSPRGLVVPVLRDAGLRSLAQIETAIRDFAERARDNRLDLDDLRGGTFTITNGGVFGSLLSTPILNPPQSAILGMHAIQDRPVARSGEVVIRPMMYLALSYDHRIIDGADAVRFLVTVKESLEDPGRLLLDL